MFLAPPDTIFAPVRRLLTVAIAVLTAAFLGACSSPSSSPSPTPASGPAPPAFSAFVDEFLDQFASHHPSIAAGNGLHQYRRPPRGLQRQIHCRRDLRAEALRVRLGTIPVDALTPDERVDHRIVGGLIDAWLLELDVNRNWQRNLMLYGSAISDGVHNLMTMESSPAEVRARRIIAKLKGVPALLAAARTNVASPPKVMAERGVRMLRGASGMLTGDLPLAFAGLSDAALKADLTASAKAAAGEIDTFVAWFEKEKLPSANGSFAVGRDNLEARYRAEELIDVPAAQLLALGERELATNEAAFVAAAARVDPKRPALDVWADVLKNHPARGALVPAAQKAVDELQAFVVAKNLVTLPASERVIVAAAPPFDLGLASMHSSPPLEETPVKSYFYITDARPEWDAARQDAWLQRFNIASLTVMTWPPGVEQPGARGGGRAAHLAAEGEQPVRAAVGRRLGDEAAQPGTRMTSPSSARRCIALRAVIRDTLNSAHSWASDGSGSPGERVAIRSSRSAQLDLAPLRDVARHRHAAAPSAAAACSAPCTAAPMAPAHVPSSAATTVTPSSEVVLTRSRSSARIGSNRRSPAAATPPPMTTRSGVMRVTRFAIPMPR